MPDAISLTLIYSLITGYALGSIPFGLIIARFTGQGDIRNIGSGNIGATNVLRTGRKDLAFITLLLDAGKAGFAFFLVHKLLGFGHPYGIYAGGMALIGHCFPVWLGFKGGKGVATYLGFLLTAAWPIGLIACGTWLITAFLSRMSSFSALMAAIVAPIAAHIFTSRELAIVSALLTLVIFIRHRANIRRILKGEEPKIGKKSKPETR
ncbi:MAG: glycerol-3-phosphate 1-O-acyltransferase PlsY [Maricaulaceae bacterium]